jgi:hypothetical protein
MEISATTLNLVIKLCNIRKKMRWQIRCNYFTSEGEAVFNILFYDNYTSALKGDIAFIQSTEEVINFRFADYKGEKAENLTDLLLDLINYEKSFVLEK